VAVPGANMLILKITKRPHDRLKAVTTLGKIKDLFIVFTPYLISE
jgi:hypothetical protein